MLEHILLASLRPLVGERPIFPRAPREVRAAVLAFYCPQDLATIAQCSRAHSELVEDEIERVARAEPRVGSRIRLVAAFNAVEVVRRRRN